MSKVLPGRCQDGTVTYDIMNVINADRYFLSHIQVHDIGVPAGYGHQGRAYLGRGVSGAGYPQFEGVR